MPKKYLGSPGSASGEEISANTGDIRDASSILGSGRSSGETNGNPLQYSCLGNAMDREAFWASVQWVAEWDTTEVT